MYVYMQVQYYGLIKQSTGEDWEKASIALSTAQPGIGGSAPHLPTRIIRFKRPPPPRIAQLVCACVVTFMKQLAWFVTRPGEEGLKDTLIMAVQWNLPTVVTYGP